MRDVDEDDDNRYNGSLNISLKPDVSTRSIYLPVPAWCNRCDLILFVISSESFPFLSVFESFGNLRMILGDGRKRESPPLKLQSMLSVRGVLRSTRWTHAAF